MTDLTYTAEINTTLYSNYPPNTKVFLKKKKKYLSWSSTEKFVSLTPTPGAERKIFKELHPHV